MNIKTNLAAASNHGGTRSTSLIKWIVIHYTSNDGDTDEANANYFKTGGRGASAHYFVDDNSVTRSVNDNVIAWSVGGTKYSDCGRTGGGKYYHIATNANSISVEMCDCNRNGKADVTAKTLKNTYELVAMLMHKYGIDINHVIRHFDVTGKYCPEYYMNSSKWKTFKEQLYKVYKDNKNATLPSSSSSSSEYTHKQFIKDVQKAIGVKVDGIAGPKTIAATIEVGPDKNKKHAVVKPIQKWLKHKGYNVGTVDGIAGPKFASAVIAFKKKELNDRSPKGYIAAKGNAWRKLLGMKLQ